VTRTIHFGRVGGRVWTRQGTLGPLWRLEPTRPGPFSIGLHPVEAEYLAARGHATLDGVCYRVSFKGWTGMIEQDGRISVRCDPA
jgi:hypothetical protein